MGNHFPLGSMVPYLLRLCLILQVSLLVYAEIVNVQYEPFAPLSWRITWEETGDAPSEYLLTIRDIPGRTSYVINLPNNIFFFVLESGSSSGLATTGGVTFQGLKKLKHMRFNLKMLILM